MSLLHTVQPGDRLSTIASLYGVRPHAILNANPRKPRARTVGGAEVFASLAFGEPILIPHDPDAPVDCLDPNAHVDRRGHCVCNPGHFVAPTGHCMQPVHFLPPHVPHTFVSVGVPQSTSPAPVPADCQPFKLDRASWSACPDSWIYTLPSGGGLCLPDGDSGCYDQAQPPPGTSKFSGSMSDPSFKLPQGATCDGNGKMGWCYQDTTSGGTPDGGGAPNCTSDADCLSGNTCQGGNCVMSSLPTQPLPIGACFDANGQPTGACPPGIKPPPGPGGDPIDACIAAGGIYDAMAKTCVKPTPAPPADTKSKTWWIIGGIAALALVGSGVYVATQHKGARL